MLSLEKLCLQPWIGFLVKICRKMSFKKKREIHFLTSFCIEMWITLPTFWWITLLSLPTLYFVLVDHTPCVLNFPNLNWWITLPRLRLSLNCTLVDFATFLSGENSLHYSLCWTVKYWLLVFKWLLLIVGHWNWIVWTGNRAQRFCEFKLETVFKQDIIPFTQFYKQFSILVCICTGPGFQSTGSITT